MIFYVIDRGVISEEDLREIPNRPLPEQIEIYTILARSCADHRKHKQPPCLSSINLPLEEEMWRQKAQEAQKALEPFLKRCFDISTGGYEGIGLAALVESRFQRG
jgi:hypothetical protein